MDIHVLHWIKVYTRQPNGQLLTGLDLVANSSQVVDFSEVFDQLRQSVFEPSFYAKQQLAIKDLAHKRGETESLYLKHIDELINLFNRN